MSSHLDRHTSAGCCWLHPAREARHELKVYGSFRGLRKERFHPLMQYSNPAMVWCCRVLCYGKAVFSHHGPCWVILPTQKLPPQPLKTLDILCSARGQRGWTHMHGQILICALICCKTKIKVSTPIFLQLQAHVEISIPFGGHIFVQ